MADHRPPRLNSGERETLLAMLQFQRESLVRKATGVSADAATTSPVGSGTTLLWLVNHMASAETFMVRRRFAGEADASPGPDADNVADAVARYQRVWGEVDAVINGAPDLDAPAAPAEDPAPTNLRSTVVSLLAELTRHVGHADILRELIDGDVGR